jgi:hypothetical protein
MVSPYQALEVLGDEEEAAPIEGLVQAQAQKVGKKGARTSGSGSQSAAATTKAQPSPAGSSSRLEQSSCRPVVGERQPLQEAVHHHQLAHCRQSVSDTVPEADVSEKQVQQMHSRFMKLVKRKGKWDHTWLVNCLNPVTAQHDPEVRSMYKQLPKPVQQAIWRSIPAGGSPKQPVATVGLRGVRGKTPQVPEAAAGGLPPQQCSQGPSGWAAAGDWTPATSDFLHTLKGRGIHHHSGLTTALNLSAPAYDAQVRTAYKALQRPDQSAVWRLLPKESPEKPQNTAMPLPTWKESVAPAAQQGKVDAPGVPMPGLGVRPAMSRLGCRPGGRAGPSAVTSTMSNSSFYSRGLGTAQCGGADRFASSVPPDLGGLSWNNSTSAPVGGYNEEEEESKLCVVCLDKSCDALLLPCKHAVMCVACAVLVKNSTGECPYCRESIDTVMCVH